MKWHGAVHTSHGSVAFLAILAASANLPQSLETELIATPKEHLAVVKPLVLHCGIELVIISPWSGSPGRHPIGLKQRRRLGLWWKQSYLKYKKKYLAVKLPLNYSSQSYLSPFGGWITHPKVATVLLIKPSSDARIAVGISKDQAKCRLAKECQQIPSQVAPNWGFDGTSWPDQWPKSTATWRWFNAWSTKIAWLRLRNFDPWINDVDLKQKWGHHRTPQTWNIAAVPWAPKPL